jgi:predicted nucleotidyltransferase
MIEARQVVAKILAQQYQSASVAIVGGSIASGRATATSDIDLLLLFEHVENAWRETFKVEQQTVELFGHDLGTFEYFCRDVDRLGGRIPIAMMVLEGENLLPPSQEYSRLFSLAKKIYAEGPPALTPQDIDNRRYEITTLLEDLVDSTVTPETLAIAVKLYEALAHFNLRSRHAWTGVGKHLSRRLCARVPDIAEKLDHALRQIVNNADDGKCEFSALAAESLAPWGGYLLEGFSIHAPTDWRIDESREPDA